MHLIGNRFSLCSLLSIHPYASKCLEEDSKAIKPTASNLIFQAMVWQSYKWLRNDIPLSLATESLIPTSQLGNGDTVSSDPMLYGSLTPLLPAQPSQ